MYRKTAFFTKPVGYDEARYELLFRNLPQAKPASPCSRP